MKRLLLALLVVAALVSAVAFVMTHRWRAYDLQQQLDHAHATKIEQEKAAAKAAAAKERAANAVITAAAEAKAKPLRALLERAEHENAALRAQLTTARASVAASQKATQDLVDGGTPDEILRAYVSRGYTARLVTPCP